MAESKHCEEAATDVEIATKAVYEFTKSFLLSGKNTFINLDGNSGRMKYVDIFGNIVGGVVGLVVPGAGQPVAAISKKPFDYGDQKIQKSRRDTFLSVLNSHSKYAEDEFQRLFIEVGVSVFLEYEPSLKKINCKVGKGDNAMENKRRAIQKLGKYAGSIFVENIIVSKSKGLEAFLEKLLKKPTKHDFFLSLYHKLKKPKFYFYVARAAPNLNIALKQTSECKKKHVTATEVFLKTFSELCKNEENVSQEDYWYLNVGKSVIVEMTCTAISSDRQFIHLTTLLSAIQNTHADVIELTEIQKKIHFYTNQEKADVNESALMEYEKNLTWDLNRNSIEIKRLSEIVDEVNDQSGSLEDIVSRISKLNKLFETRELLTKELEEVNQRIIKVKTNHPKWDTFLCQNMIKSNKDDLEKILAEMNEIMSHLSQVLSSNFSDEYLKNEEKLERLHQNLELSSITKVTDNCSLEDARKANQIIFDELTHIRNALPGIKEALLALQMIRLHVDFTIISFERSLATAEQAAFKNLKEMEQLLVLINESQTLEEIIFVGIQEMELELEADPTTIVNIRDSENSFVLSMLQNKVEDYCKQAQQLIPVHEHLLRVAPSFQIKSNDIADRIKNLRTAIAKRIEKQASSYPRPTPTDAPNALPKPIWSSNKVNGFPPRERHAAVAVGKTIYSFGGINEKGHSTYAHDGPMDVFVMNANKGKLKWKLLAIKNNEIPNQRRAHSAASYKESVFIFGGFDNKKNNYSNSTWRFDTKTLQWNQLNVSGNIPEARSRHTAVVYRNQMLVFGGDNKRISIKLRNDLHSLDLESFHWSTIQTKGIPPPIRHRHSATVYKDRFIFIFGGNDSETYKCLNDLYCYNLNSKEWTQPKTSGILPQARQGHSALAHNGLIFIFGGSTDGILWFNKYLNDLFCYNPETFEWKEVQPIGKSPSPHCNMSCVALDNRIFIFGGSCGSSVSDTFVLEMK